MEGVGQTRLCHFTDEKTEARREEPHPQSHGVTPFEPDPGRCSGHSSQQSSLHSLGPRFSIWTMRTAGVAAGP